MKGPQRPASTTSWKYGPPASIEAHGNAEIALFYFSKIVAGNCMSLRSVDPVRHLARDLHRAPAEAALRLPDDVRGHDPVFLF